PVRRADGTGPRSYRERRWRVHRGRGRRRRRHGDDERHEISGERSHLTSARDVPGGGEAADAASAAHDIASVTSVTAGAGLRVHTPAGFTVAASGSAST